MLYYLDSVVVIYAVEGVPADQLRVTTHLDGLELTGHRFILSDLSRAECMVQVLGPGADQRLSSFFRFFHSEHVRTVSLTPATFARAAAIRGGHRYSTSDPKAKPKRYSFPDALHLAAAVESGCDRFLTNDHRLAGFPDIVVEVLPP